MAKVHDVCVVSNSKDHVPPLEFLQAATGEYASWHSFVFVKDGELKANMDDKPANPTDLLETFKTYGGTGLIASMGSEDGAGFNTDNVQPFTCLTSGEGDKAVDQIYVFLSGTFSKYIDEKKTTSPAFNFFEKAVKPATDRLSRMAKGDLENIAAEIATTDFGGALIELACPLDNDECTITFVMANETGNSIVSYFGSDSMAEEQWGWASTKLGKNSWPITAPSTTTTASSSRMKSNITKAKPPENTETRPVIAVQTAPDKPDPKTTTAVSEGSVIGKPPEIIQKGSNNSKRAFYNKFKGNVPSDFATNPEFMVKPEMVEAFIKAGGVVTRRIASAPVSGTNNQASAIPLPILTKTQKEGLQTHIKTIDANGRKIMTPEEMDKAQQNRPTFTELCGAENIEDLGYFANWQNAYQLAKADPMWAALAISDMFSNMMREKAAMELMSAEQDGVAAPAIIKNRNTG